MICSCKYVTINNKIIIQHEQHWICKTHIEAKWYLLSSNIYFVLFLIYLV